MVKEIKSNIFHCFSCSNLSEEESIIIRRGGKLPVKLQLTLHNACHNTSDPETSLEKWPQCFWKPSDPLGILYLVYV